MKKIIVSTFALAMLGSSSTFADSNKLSAFQGINTSAVSAAELNQVSGEGLLQSLLGTTGLLNILPNVDAALKLNGENILSVSSGALVQDVVGTADQLVDDVVGTVDGVVDNAINLVNSLDPSVNVNADISIAGLNVNTSLAAGL